MKVVTELLKSFLKPKPKIIALGKCILENGDWMEIKLKGFTYYASTEAEKYCCATYVKHEYVNMFIIDRLSPHYVTLHTAGTEITIGTQRQRAKTWDPENRWHRGSHTRIVGDLNPISNMWSAGKRNTQGNLLREWLDERPNLEVVNRYEIRQPPPPTNQSHSSSTIDLVIANPECKVRVKYRLIAATEHGALEIKTGFKWTQRMEKPLRYNKGGLEEDRDRAHPARRLESQTLAFTEEPLRHHP